MDFTQICLRLHRWYIRHGYTAAARSVEDIVVTLGKQSALKLILTLGA
jgi:hypothetical protein